MKLLTEFPTLAASLVTVAIFAAVRSEARAVTEFLSASTDEVIALVSFGKSLLAELTSVVALAWIIVTCECRPLIPPLTFKLLTEFCRLVASLQ